MQASFKVHCSSHAPRAISPISKDLFVSPIVTVCLLFSGYLTSCSFDYLTKETRGRVMIFLFFSAAWVAPFCVISYCYIRICRVVLHVRAQSSVDVDSSRHCKESEKRRTELKVCIAVLCVDFSTSMSYWKNQIQHKKLGYDWLNRFSVQDLNST